VPFFMVSPHVGGEHLPLAQIPLNGHSVPTLHSTQLPAASQTLPLSAVHAVPLAALDSPQTFALHVGALQSPAVSGQSDASAQPPPLPPVPPLPPTPVVAELDWALVTVLVAVLVPPPPAPPPPVILLRSTGVASSQPSPTGPSAAAATKSTAQTGAFRNMVEGSIVREEEKIRGDPA
jgi:hypothetical protein